MDSNKTPLVDHISRSPETCSKGTYDLIIIGGGIYGITLALESSRRNLKALLLEQEDFGGKTTCNYLRIIHGGLRYLSALDLVRFYDSVKERSWFLRHFPTLVQPLDCLLPLYGESHHKPSFFRCALALNTMLSIGTNRDLRPEMRIRPGKVLTPEQTIDLFPSVNRQGLKGGALWQDGFVPNAPRLLIELLRWACRYGACAVNYCRVDRLVANNGQAQGVEAQDVLSGRTYRYTAPIVINAAGPWCRDIASAFDRDISLLFPKRILVWNLLFDRSQLSSCALAIRGRNTSHTYFIPPWRDRLLVGTGHAVLHDGEYRPPKSKELAVMIDDCNASIPGLKLTANRIKRIFWGIMPGKENGQLGRRPVFFDHSVNSGPMGLYSVSGVKFTTARKVADQCLSRIFGNSSLIKYGKDFQPSQEFQRRILDTKDLMLYRSFLQNIMKHESITSLADLVLRRVDMTDKDDFIHKLDIMKELFDIDILNWKKQVDVTLSELDGYVSKC
jgi:glycerol-3-phosphate dehydrogenase